MNPEVINQIKKNGIYNTTSLAAILGISEVTARFYCRNGKIPAHKLGKGWKVLGQSIIDYLASEGSEPQPQTIIPLK